MGTTNNNYDGEIRINTRISEDGFVKGIKNMSSQSIRLSNQIKAAEDEVKRLIEETKELGETKIPTQEYEEIQKQIQKTEEEFNKLIERQDQMIAQGKNHGTQWDLVQSKMEEAGNTIRYAKGELEDLVETGKAFTLGRETDAYKKKAQQIEKLNNKLREYDAKVKEIKEKEERLNQSVKNLGKVAVESFGKVKNVLTGLDSVLNKFGATAKKVFKKLHSDTQKENGFLAMIKSRFNGIALSLLVFNWITRGFNAMVAGMKEGFQNLAKYSDSYNKSISSLISANSQLKNSFATAFQPIVELVIPYLVQLINYATKAVNTVTQLFAVLSGKNTWTRAKSVNEDYRDSLDGVAESAEEAEKALKGYLSPIDTINRFQVEDSKKKDSDTGENLFEEVPVAEDIKALAEKIKSILSSLFLPLKESWNREGKFVMDSWREALDTIGDLIQSIGKDFLTVWNQETSVQMFKDILHIIGDVGLVVSNLASNFEAAWKKNETGLHILENIRDIFAAIVSNIKHAADFTVDWSAKLNFTPLLEAFERFTASLVPAVDALSGVLTDFYEKVLLPLAKWTIEKGLPELLDVFTAFNERIDWAALRQRLSDFWEHLEPFAETVGEGLIIFIERCANALADFVESGEFDRFLTKIEEWMDDVKPEDVADALEAIANAIIGLKGALVGFKGLTTFATIVKTIKDLGLALKNFGGFGLSAGSTLLFFQTLDQFSQNKEIENSMSNLAGQIENLKEQLDSGEITLEQYNAQVENLRNESQKEMVFNIRGLNPDDYDSNGWNKKLSDIGSRISEWWESIKDKYSWDALFSDVNEWWTTSVAPKLEEIKTSLITWWESMEENYSWDTLFSDISKWFDESVKPWFTTERWSELWEEVSAAFSNKWGEITTWWKSTAIYGWWNKDVAPWFTKEKWSGILKNIKESLAEVWNKTVGEWKQSIVDWWNDDVAPWFTEEKWRGVLENIRTTFSNIFSDVVSLVSESMGKAFDKVVDWVSKIKSKVSGIFSNISALVGGLGSSIGNAISSLTSSNSLLDRIGAGYSANTKIPGYATGTVIPPSMSRHIAVLGDNNRETEVVSPLSTIEKAMENVLSRNQGNSGNYRFTAQINGKVLFDEFIKEAKLRQMATGKNPLELI